MQNSLMSVRPFTLHIAKHGALEQQQHNNNFQLRHASTDCGASLCHILLCIRVPLQHDINCLITGHLCCCVQ